MCRLAAYFGPPAPLSTLLFDPPRSLQQQAADPREQIYGEVNVDGTGVAWWSEAHGAEPLRYVTDRPPWSDPNLPALAPRLGGHVQLASVRSATIGHPFGPGNVAPYTYGRFAGAHNGFLGRYREATARRLTALLPDRHYAALGAVSDSQALFLRTVSLLEERPELGLAGAVRMTLREARDIARACDTLATLNLIVSDGRTIVATRTSHEAECNSLYTHDARAEAEGAPWAGALLLASEPLDDDTAWRSVPEHSLVQLSSSGLEITGLDDE